MITLFIGLIAGLFTGFLLGRVLPIESFHIAGMMIVLLMILLFFVFQSGLCDFQEFFSCGSLACSV